MSQLKPSSAKNTEPAPPTVELTGASGDYSALLSWTASDNGALIEGYELTYCYADSPDNEIGRVEIRPGVNSITLSGLSGGIEHIIKITAKNSAGSTTATVTVTPNDPDLATVTAVKNEIEASVVAIHMNLANTKDTVASYLSSYFSRYSEYGVRIKDVVITDFHAAQPVTAEDPDAAPGEFTFILELEKGDVSLTTRRINAEIDNKTSIVYLSADRFSVMTGEKLTVKATALDIKDKTYYWYSTASDNDKGSLIQSSESDTCDIKTDKPGVFYIYCVCGGVSSPKIKFTVSEPFVAVSDIELSTDTITAGEAEILRSTVYPSNAANKNILWSIENDGGCLAELSGRTITAYKPGTVTVKATVNNGLSDGDYEKIFYITVKEKSTDHKTTDETEDASDTDIKETEFDCAKINGIESLTVTAENGAVQITPVTEETVKRILSESNIEETEYEIIGAVKFVYEKNAIAHETQMKIKGYDGKYVRILSINSNGSRALSEKEKPVNGIIHGNAVSPDTVILLCEKEDKDASGVFPAALILVIPAAAAVIIIAYIMIKEDGKKKKRRVK
ncbi:MAG: Ig-like domain-containing protein [Clostridia bacterium]|nr:Ig-like domain-containing protein [Clostridia bacterium]